MSLLRDRPILALSAEGDKARGCAFCLILLVTHPLWAQDPCSTLSIWMCSIKIGLHMMTLLEGETQSHEECHQHGKPLHSQHPTGWGECWQSCFPGQVLEKAGLKGLEQGLSKAARTNLGKTQV